MGDVVVVRRVTVLVAVVGLLLAMGCQQGQQQAVIARRLVQHQAMLDFSGLRPASDVIHVHAKAAVPEKWQTLPVQKTAIYAHQQWRSPTKQTGIGVAYIRMPLPLSAKAIVWFAKGEYAKKNKNGNDGRLIGEWTDSVGRHWFEAENAKYHVRGYAVTKGFEAWIVYSGYRSAFTPDPAELSLATRAAASFVPAPLETGKPREATASASVR